MSDELEHSAEVQVPAGAFRMGRPRSDLFADEAEQPEREVQLSAFAIDVFPVTNLRFRAFLEAGGYEDPQWWSSEGWRLVQAESLQAPRSFETALLAGDDQPACGLSWHEADAFARFEGRRLPTSAEWERAARGTDGRAFPWGDAFPRADLCNFADAHGATTPIGHYPAGRSPSGIEDAAGNVNNWVADLAWDGFGDWCVAEGRLSDPCLTLELARELNLPTDQRLDRGGGYLTPLVALEVLTTTRPLAWPATSRELWHGFRTARTL